MPKQGDGIGWIKREESGHKHRHKEERDRVGEEAQRFPWQSQERWLQRWRWRNTTESSCSPDLKRRKWQYGAGIIQPCKH